MTQRSRFASHGLSQPLRDNPLHVLLHEVLSLPREIVCKMLMVPQLAQFLNHHSCPSISDRNILRTTTRNKWSGASDARTVQFPKLQSPLHGVEIFIHNATARDGMIGLGTVSHRKTSLVLSYFPWSNTKKGQGHKRLIRMMKMRSYRKQERSCCSIFGHAKSSWGSAKGMKPTELGSPSEQTAPGALPTTKRNPMGHQRGRAPWFCRNWPHGSAFRWRSGWGYDGNSSWWWKHAPRALSRFLKSRNRNGLFPFCIFLSPLLISLWWATICVWEPCEVGEKLNLHCWCLFGAQSLWWFCEWNSYSILFSMMAGVLTAWNLLQLNLQHLQLLVIHLSLLTCLRVRSFSNGGYTTFCDRDFWNPANHCQEGCLFEAPPTEKRTKK